MKLLFIFLVIFCTTSAYLLERQSNQKNSLRDLPPICHGIPPALWCSCKTLAQTCGHTEDCENYAHYSWNEPVHLTLFYESLCPDCQRFIIKELFPTVYLTPLRQLMRLELVPYGNARRYPNGTIHCQHGEKECRINKYESCVIKFIKDPVPFIVCLEKQIEDGEEDFEEATRHCYFAEHTLPHIYDQIAHCANSELGNKLQANAAARTERAWPDQHQFVPWMLFNNVSIANQQFLFNDLSQTICLFYVGDEHKKHCAGLKSLATPNSVRNGCLRNW